MIIVTSSFSRSSVFKMFVVHTKNAKPAFSDSSGLSGVFDRIGLFSWRISVDDRLTKEINGVFQISST